MRVQFDATRLPAACQALRLEVREFLGEQRAQGLFDPRDPDVGARNAKEFAKRVAARGWIGMTWPKAYGGQARSYLERHVVTEEMRVAQAPVRQFFVADRQSGPTLIRYGSEEIKQSMLPRMARGEISFCIGMSEPDSGSDLFAARASAAPADGGWRLNGTKVWTSNAHLADYMIGLFRTAPPTSDNRRHGLTSFVIDMRAPGISCHPIGNLSGARDFNEVVFQDVFISKAQLVGELHGAWKQATSELAYERSGPERFLENFSVLQAVVAVAGNVGDVEGDARLAVGLGRLVSQLHVLRRMSVSVAGMLAEGKEPMVEAAIVKDVGTVWEQALPHRIRDMSTFLEPDGPGMEHLRATLARELQLAPKFTLQGGTTEILRGIIARGLGLR